MGRSYDLNGKSKLKNQCWETTWNISCIYKLYYIFTTGIYNPTLGPASRHWVTKKKWLLWTLSFRAKRDASKKGPASWSLSGGAPSWRTAAWQRLFETSFFCTSVKSVYPKDRKDPPMEW